MLQPTSCPDPKPFSPPRAPSDPSALLLAQVLYLARTERLVHLERCTIGALLALLGYLTLLAEIMRDPSAPNAALQNTERATRPTKGPRTPSTPNAQGTSRTPGEWSALPRSALRRPSATSIRGVQGTPSAPSTTSAPPTAPSAPPAGMQGTPRDRQPSGARRGALQVHRRALKQVVCQSLKKVHQVLRRALQVHRALKPRQELRALKVHQVLRRSSSPSTTPNAQATSSKLRALQQEHLLLISPEHLLV